MQKQLFMRRDRSDVVVLHILEPELSDLVLQDELLIALLDFVKEHQPKKLVLDLSDVDYCATGVINTFLLVRKHILDLGGEFKLCSLSTSLQLAFRSLNLANTVFSIHESADAAVVDFQTSA